LGVLFVTQNGNTGERILGMITACGFPMNNVLGAVIGFAL